MFFFFFQNHTRDIGEYNKYKYYAKLQIFKVLYIQRFQGLKLAYRVIGLDIVDILC